MTVPTIPSVRKTITVRAGQQRAFDVFTARFDTWWPREHHIGAADMAEAILEPKTGGRFYERGVDGSECEWGRVLTYDPPTRLVLSWHLQGDWTYDADEAHASEIEVVFVPVDAHTTRVELAHRLFERHGAGARAVHDGVDTEGGWTGLLARFAAAATP